MRGRGFRIGGKQKGAMKWNQVFSVGAGVVA